MPDLGKYAEAVLSAYGASAVLIVALIWVSLRAARRAKTELEQAEARRDG